MAKKIDEKKIEEIKKIIMKMPKRSNAEIAKMLGVDKTTVRRYRERLIAEEQVNIEDGYKERRAEKIKEVEEAIMKMPEESNRQIARLFGFAESTVRKCRKKLMEKEKQEEQVPENQEMISGYDEIQDDIRNV